MGQQQVVGAFPGLPASTVGLGNNMPPLNMEDVGAGPPAAWSLGATMAQTIPPQPPLGHEWTLIAWTINYYGMLAYTQSGAHGTLGKLVGGAVLGSLSIGSTVQPWVQPAAPLPSVASALDTIWDGAQDPIFPAIDNTNTVRLRQATHTFVLNTPISLLPGDGLSVGLWLMPALTSSVITLIAGATYTLVFDDGAPPVQGWGG